MEEIRFREMFIDKRKEAFSDVSCHVLAKWWVKPQDIPLSRILRTGCLQLAWCKGEPMAVDTFVECFLIDAFNAIEALFI